MAKHRVLGRQPACTKGLRELGVVHRAGPAGANHRCRVLKCNETEAVAGHSLPLPGYLKCGQQAIQGVALGTGGLAGPRTMRGVPMYPQVASRAWIKGTHSTTPVDPFGCLHPLHTHNSPCSVSITM